MHLRSLAAAALLLAATPALADDYYLRTGIGRVDAKDLEADQATSWSLGVGWRFVDWLSVEAAYNDLGTYFGTEPAVGGPLNEELTSLELGLAGKLAFGDSGFFAQARAGMHRWESKRSNVEALITETGNDPFYGIGIGYDFGKYYGVSLGVERYQASDEDHDRVMLTFELR